MTWLFSELHVCMHNGEMENKDRRLFQLRYTALPQIRHSLIRESLVQESPSIKASKGRLHAAQHTIYELSDLTETSHWSGHLRHAEIKPVDTSGPLQTHFPRHVLDMTVGEKKACDLIQIYCQIYRANNRVILLVWNGGGRTGRTKFSQGILTVTKVLGPIVQRSIRKPTFYVGF